MQQESYSHARIALLLSALLDCKGIGYNIGIDRLMVTLGSRVVTFQE